MTPVWCAGRSGPGLRQLTENDIPAAAHTLAEAFHDDPVKCFLVGVDEVPMATSLPFFRAFLNIQMPHGLDVRDRPASSRRRCGRRRALEGAGHPDRQEHADVRASCTRPRILRNLLRAQRHGARHPKEPHYYLEFVGTRPRPRERAGHRR